MGSTFRYIADDALRVSELGDCQFCERPGVPSYKYTGIIVHPSQAANAALAAEEPELFAACADCIHAGHVRKDDYEISRILDVLNAFATDQARAVSDYHLTPHIPLMMQDEDWPFCCNDWCEFIGNPADDEASVRVPANFTYWDHRPTPCQWDFELRPESLREVCLFRCLSCPKTYFIWQPT
jgi:hypothetical protein